MSEKKKRQSFTFEIPQDFFETFDQFQKVANNDERSCAALIRFLIKEHVAQAQSGS